MNDTQMAMLVAARDLIETILSGANAEGVDYASKAPADLDGKYGDPLVRAKDPRDWTGEPMKGRNFSQCPPEYLDMLAARFDFFASRESDPKKAKYNRLDAARARGWAARKRGGWQSPEAAPVSDSPWSEAGGFETGGFEDVPDDSIPF